MADCYSHNLAESSKAKNVLNRSSNLLDGVKNILETPLLDTFGQAESG